MSRSVKKRAYGNVGHIKVRRRMTAYGAEGGFKLRALKTDHVPGRSKGVSRYDKLVTKNANRTLKKKIRVKLKNHTLCE